jgi:hypothetical protein
MDMSRFAAAYKTLQRDELIRSCWAEGEELSRRARKNIVLDQRRVQVPMINCVVVCLSAMDILVVEQAERDSS